MTARRLVRGVAGAAGIRTVPDRSDYDDSRAPTRMAIDSDDSRFTGGTDR